MSKQRCIINIDEIPQLFVLLLWIFQRRQAEFLVLVLGTQESVAPLQLRFQPAASLSGLHRRLLHAIQSLNHCRKKETNWEVKKKYSKIKTKGVALSAETR